jgi:hypothetical protein
MAHIHNYLTIQLNVCGAIVTEDFVYVFVIASPLTHTRILRLTFLTFNEYRRSMLLREHARTHRHEEKEIGDFFNNMLYQKVLLISMNKVA